MSIPFSEIRGVIFDMDGTLTRPVIDFAEMRRRLDLPEGDILATIRAWPPERQRRAFAIIEALEADARERMALQPGARELLETLERLGLERGLLTRNTLETVRRLQELIPVRFSAVVTRDFPTFKPDPAPALHIASLWRLPPSAILLVGDYRDDLICGRQAGMFTVLLLEARNRQWASLADWTVPSLDELRRAFERSKTVLNGSKNGPPRSPRS